MSATATGGTNGVYIKEAPEPSEAYRMGFRSHMVIKELDGVAINNIDDFLHYYRCKSEKGALA